MAFSDYVNKRDNQVIIVPICSASSYSYGSHGFGDNPDVYADDCSQDVEWEFYFEKFPPQVASLLQGEFYLHNDNSFRSAHECQIASSVWIYISDANKIPQLKQLLSDHVSTDDFNDYEYYKPRMKPFVSYADAVKVCSHTKMGDISPNKEFNKPNVAPENIWNNRIEIEKMRNKQYDGD